MDAVSPASSSSHGHPRKLKYPMEWASGVAEQALQHHTRAWKILLDIAKLSPRQLAILIASGDPAWPQIRSLVHQIDKWLVAPRASTLSTTQMLSLAVQFTLKKASGPLPGWLTDQIRAKIIEEQGNSGEASPPGEPPPPFSPRPRVQFLLFGGCEYVDSQGNPTSGPQDHPDNHSHEKESRFDRHP